MKESGEAGGCMYSTLGADRTCVFIPFNYPLSREGIQSPGAAGDVDDKQVACRIRRCHSRRAMPPYRQLLRSLLRRRRWQGPKRATRMNPTSSLTYGRVPAASLTDARQEPLASTVS
mmetsp:Transcript_30089/g.66185  ORF Transcript_30089/g.66185 Transcript_30089/m.66185 type:complete len:117 (+) Transcript_30089:87-437(+)